MALAAKIGHTAIRGRPAATATMRASMKLRWPSTVAAADVALDLDLGGIGAGGQRALGDRGAHRGFGVVEGRRLVGEIAGPSRPRPRGTALPWAG